MTKILAISDLHGDFSLVPQILDMTAPDLLLCCGDWGDPEEISIETFKLILDSVHTLSVYGNHDDIDLLGELRNTDGSPVLLPPGGVVEYNGIHIAGISGIWAKSHNKRWYVTDEDVQNSAESSAKEGVDILVTHGCAVGLNDVIFGNRRGGHRCFLEAFRICSPWVYICGHLHLPQMRRTKDNKLAINVGQTAKGDYALIEYNGGIWNASVKKLNYADNSY